MVEALCLWHGRFKPWVVDLEIGHHAGLFDDMRAFRLSRPGAQHLL
jgi:hypothetical protein